VVLIAGLLLTYALAAAAQEGGCVSCHETHFTREGRCASCHRGDPQAVRETLAHHGLLRGPAAAWRMPGSPILTRGRAMRDSLGCRRCHTTGGRGERLAIDLDTAVWERSQTQLRDALQKPAASMPDFALTTAQCDTLAALLLHDGDPHPAQETYQVRFQHTASDTVPVFTRLCGDCHRALGRGGPMGSGRDGPDLSGLTGEFYPVPIDARWDAERLEKWLANPRSLRPATTMPPVRVNRGELQAILRELSGLPAR